MDITVTVVFGKDEKGRPQIYGVFKEEKDAIDAFNFLSKENPELDLHFSYWAVQWAEGAKVPFSALVY